MNDDYDLMKKKLAALQAIDIALVQMENWA